MTSLHPGIYQKGEIWQRERSKTSEGGEDFPGARERAGAWEEDGKQSAVPVDFASALIVGIRRITIPGTPVLKRNVRSAVRHFGENQSVWLKRINHENRRFISGWES